MEKIKTLIATIVEKPMAHLKNKREMFKNRKKNAEALVNTIIQSTSIRICTHNYNTKGEEIRGWHRPSPRFYRDNAHPLETYYKRK